MKNKSTEPLELAHYINRFLSEYAPSHLTNSDNTLDSYGTALTLYIGYLEAQRGITPDRFSQDCFDSFTANPHVQILLPTILFLHILSMW